MSVLPFPAVQSPRLPSVADSGVHGELLLHSSRDSSARSRGTHVRLRDGSAFSRTVSQRSFPSQVYFDPFNSYNVNDLTNYSMTDQRWTLQRKKIGLKRSTKGAKQKQERNLLTRDLNISYIINNFQRKECLRYVLSPDIIKEGSCFCGLMQEEHIPLTKLLRGSSNNRQNGTTLRFNTVMEDMEDEEEDTGLSLLSSLPFGSKKKSKKPRLLFKRQSLLAPLSVATAPATNIISVEEDDTKEIDQGRDNSLPVVDDLLHTSMITSSRRRQSDGSTDQSLNRPATPTRVPPPDSEWTPETHYRAFKTNAYGQIEFTNETAGSNKPAKYVRIADDTNIDRLLTFLVDYWQLLEPHRPQLVISVTGGAKHFKLDGRKKEIFCSGLIKAVKSTNAWIVSGGMHVGVMKIVGEAVNKGQYIVKVKRKTLLAEEKETFVRGIRCLAVCPWGYIQERDTLINENPDEFADVRYKVQCSVKMHENMSLDGDHTHFLLVDDGSRNQFRGSDNFRTRMEEAIQEPEPVGLGIPVVLLLVEGGVSSIYKCVTSLRKNLPIMIVAGTGRAADLIAYAVSMTIRKPSGKYVMRKGHREQIKTRIALTMTEISGNEQKQKACADMIIECCGKKNLITIFDINSNESLDKYILYALLSGEANNSRLDQLTLSLLWNRPDIAEQHLFTADCEWPSGALEDLMTQALLDEKVEFVNLLIINGVVMSDYLTVQTLRTLYNNACEPNDHLTRLLQRASKSNYHHLVHVHLILEAMLRRHNDPVYLADTPTASVNDTAINCMTFEDSYQELLLWSIFSRRGHLARYLWERCNSPLSAALIASGIYNALWVSLGAKNTDIRDEYEVNKKKFENLACELTEVSYKQDVINAMGLVERRLRKWGDRDCLELAKTAKDQLFISTPCAQASIDLNWRRGMLRAPYYCVILANFLPFLVFFRKLIRFQNLGDYGGELKPWQKLLVFYKSPISKFYAHSTSYVIFLLLYSYVVLFDFRYEMSFTEKVVVAWLVSFFVDEIAELVTEYPKKFKERFKDWTSTVWNKFDLVSMCLATTALGLRSFRSTFKWGRIAYAMNTPVFYVRLFRIYHVSYHLGPKLVIFNRMIQEVVVFMALLVIFVMGYGIASQGLLHPGRDMSTFNTTTVGQFLDDLLLTPYWQMYGELLLENLEGDDAIYCHSKSCLETPFLCNTSNDSQCLLQNNCLCEGAKEYTWVVKVLLFFYLIIGNIMLLNLLIAIFTYVFEEVQQNSMEIWKFEMYCLNREYDLKPSLVPPFVVFEYIWRLAKHIWKATCRKKKENLEDYMMETLNALKVFEKEVLMSYLMNISLEEEESVDQRLTRMSEKIDRICNYVEQREELEELEEDLEWVIGESENIQKENNQIKNDSSSIPKAPPPPPPPQAQKRKARRSKNHMSFAPALAAPPTKVKAPRKLATDEEEDEDVDDILGSELSEDDIEMELKKLKQMASTALGEITPYMGRSRPMSRTRPLTGGMRNAENILSRLEGLEAEMMNTRQSLENSMNLILSRLDGGTPEPPLKTKSKQSKKKQSD